MRGSSQCKETRCTGRISSTKLTPLILLRSFCCVHSILLGASSEGGTMASIHIEALNPDATPQACRILAQAFVANPLNIAAFGPAQLARNEAFFRVGLAAMKGVKLVAIESSRILGLIHWVRSPQCQISGFEKLRL